MFDPAVLTDAAGFDIKADIVEQGNASLLGSQAGLLCLQIAAMTQRACQHCA